ncbi:MAG: ABC transporter permease [Anaerolineae bacterium]|nr:ABC transporter permease [Anaerolineae bacterium]
MALNQMSQSSTRVLSGQRDSVRQYANPIKMVRNLWSQRELIFQLTKREVLQRYKGSYLGVLWSFVTPLALLLVYTFAFSVILQARWQGDNTENGHLIFALNLFGGLIPFTVFTETLSSASALIIRNPNYVKKVVFPLEMLVMSKLGASIIDSLFGIVILLLGTVIILGAIPWTIILLPIMYLPLIFLCLGLSWFFASLGVFVRDVGNFLNVVIRMLFFVTPIFYPLSSVPANIRVLLYLNPLTFIVNHFRRVILWGQMPDWGEFLVLTAITFVICLLGYIWFMKSKKTFADVI